MQPPTLPILQKPPPLEICAMKRKREEVSAVSDSHQRLRIKSYSSPLSSTPPNQSAAAADRISNLPLQLQASILSLLPIKEAARTSVLSTRWRDIWLSLPCLNLNQSLGFSPESSSFNPLTWYYTVRQIMMQRRCYGPIHTCNVILPIPQYFSALLRSFLPNLVIGGEGIRCLNLSNVDSADDSSTFYVPERIFTCRHLEQFMVQGCTFYFSPDYTPASNRCNIRSLELLNVYVTDKDFQLLMLSTCGTLQELCLEEVFGLRNLVLPSVPKLTTLRVLGTGLLRKISLTGAPHLSTFALDLFCLMPDGDDSDDEEKEGTNNDDAVGKQGTNNDDREVKEGTNLVELLMDLHGIEQLFLQYVQESHEDQVLVDRRRIHLPQCLPPDCLLFNLRELEMKLSLADAGLVPILSCLLCSSPNLRVLQIEDDEYGIVSKEQEVVDGHYWKTRQIPSCLGRTISLVQLKNVNLTSQAVTGFIKFILMNSRVLKTMKVARDHVAIHF